MLTLKVRAYSRGLLVVDGGHDLRAIVGATLAKKSENTMKVCRDHASDKAGEAVMRNMKGCTVSNESFSGHVYSLAMHCAIAGTVIDSKAATTFQSDTAVHSESHVSYTPAMNGETDQTMISDQTYLGNCPAGVKPGIVH